MKILTVEAEEVQHRFDELLDHVGRGDIVAITKNGRSIALMTPPGMDEHMARISVAEAMKEGRKGV